MAPIANLKIHLSRHKNDIEKSILFSLPPESVDQIKAKHVENRESLTKQPQRNQHKVKFTSTEIRQEKKKKKKKILQE